MKTTSRTSPQWTFARLIDAYERTPHFAQLSPSTQANYGTYLKYIREHAGAFDVRSFQRQNIIAVRDARAAKRAAANQTVAVFKVLFEHAIDLGVRRDNPAKGVKPIKGGESHKPWPAWAIRRWRDNTTGLERTALELGLGTSQRLSDLVEMRWSDIEDGGIHVTQKKTKKTLWVSFSDELIAYLATVKPEGLYILSVNGQRLTRNALQHRLAKVRGDLRLTEYVPHGWRATAAVELAEAGKTPHQIASVTGHADLRNVVRYTKDVDQRKLAKQARENGTNTETAKNSAKPSPKNRKTLE